MKKSVFILSVIFLSGCAVGPKFQTPSTAAVQSYTSRQLPNKTESAPISGGASQSFAPGKELSRQWWKIFGSDKLNNAIDYALANSQTLAAAQASLLQAQEIANAQAGLVLYPQAGADLFSSRQKVSGAASGQGSDITNIYSLHSASVSVSYLFDFFGAGRKSLEALRSGVDYQKFQLEAARLSLASNIAMTVVQEVFLRHQISAYKDIIESQEKQLEMLNRQFELGGSSRADVLAQQASLGRNQAVLPAFEKELGQVRNRLAILCGIMPSDEKNIPNFGVTDLILPREIPVSLPSSLAHRRPDIQASEALAKAACAQAGVAAANMYPQIILSASYGPQANDFAGLFDSNNNIWSVAAGLTQPVFNGGQLRAKRRAAGAAYDQAIAQYRQTVLSAFGDVADVLLALESDAGALKAQVAAESAAQESFQLRKKQFEAGAISYNIVLEADQQYQQALTGRIAAQAARFSDTIALFAALGGGWDNQEAKANDKTNSKDQLPMIKQ
jgi:NodT family efflux transporter outer membrane factor (OMF) lipoprotein